MSRMKVICLFPLVSFTILVESLLGLRIPPEVDAEFSALFPYANLFWAGYGLVAGLAVGFAAAPLLVGCLVLILALLLVAWGMQG